MESKEELESLAAFFLVSALGFSLSSSITSFASNRREEMRKGRKGKEGEIQGERGKGGRHMERGKKRRERKEKGKERGKKRKRERERERERKRIIPSLGGASSLGICSEKAYCELFSIRKRIRKRKEERWEDDKREK